VIQEFLSEVELFKELDDEELAHVLMSGLVRRFPAEAVILSEGGQGAQLMVIHEGQVRISKVIPGIGEEALTILGPGEFFGEIAFFDGGTASAHAIAHSDCELWCIPHREVQRLMESHPALTAKFLWAFGRTLATRLRRTDEKMASVLAISRTF
jgi:CRP/FNR family cyclic AMP-dependent transcriptional regulator